MLQELNWKIFWSPWNRHGFLVFNIFSFEGINGQKIASFFSFLFFICNRLEKVLIIFFIIAGRGHIGSRSGWFSGRSRIPRRLTFFARVCRQRLPVGRWRRAFWRLGHFRFRVPRRLRNDEWRFRTYASKIVQYATSDHTTIKRKEMSHVWSVNTHDSTKITTTMTSDIAGLMTARLSNTPLVHYRSHHDIEKFVIC